MSFMKWTIKELKLKLKIAMFKEKIVFKLIIH